MTMGGIRVGQVKMPELQRGQFLAMGVVGLWAASPLLSLKTLTYTAVVTLYTVAAFAIRTTVRWRSAKQLYQQLLLSYQNRNRTGSADGALLTATRLAEEEHGKQALIILHTLLLAEQRQQQTRQYETRNWNAEIWGSRHDFHTARSSQQPQDDVREGGLDEKFSSDGHWSEPQRFVGLGAVSTKELAQAHAKVFNTWSEFRSEECYHWSDWRVRAQCFF